MKDKIAELDYPNNCSVSVGIAIYPQDSDSFQTLYNHATDYAERLVQKIMRTRRCIW